MRYSISNAIPHNPKSKKHPYETLANGSFCFLWIVKASKSIVFPFYGFLLFLLYHSFRGITIEK